MRILFYSYAYPSPVTPGVGTFNRTMLGALAVRNVMHVVCPVPWPLVGRALMRGKWSAESNRNFEAVGGIPADYLPYYYPPKIGRNSYHHCLWWSTGRKLKEVISDFNPQVILSYWAHPDGAVAVRAAHKMGLPAVVIVGGSDVLLLARRGGRRRAILRVLREADAVVAVSQDIAEVLRHDGIPAEKVHVVYRGVDRRIFSPGDQQVARKNIGYFSDEPLILGVGRLSPVKDWPTLIRACAVLRDREIKFNCRIVGSGELNAELSRQILDYKLQSQVELVGGLGQGELGEWYRAADVLGLCSISEGVPNVLLEGMSCGKPFVASHVGGIPEIADPFHDRLCATGDYEAFADAFQQLFNRDTSLPLPPRWLPPPSLENSAEKLMEVLNSVGVHSKSIRNPKPVKSRETSTSYLSQQ